MAKVIHKMTHFYDNSAAATALEVATIAGAASILHTQANGPALPHLLNYRIVDACLWARAELRTKKYFRFRSGSIRNWHPGLPEIHFHRDHVFERSALQARLHPGVTLQACQQIMQDAFVVAVTDSEHAQLRNAPGPSCAVPRPGWHRYANAGIDVYDFERQGWLDFSQLSAGKDPLTLRVIP